MKVIRTLALAAFACLAHVPTASAADWPTKPVRVIVPFAPGAGTDVIMRYYAPPLSEALGQSIVIENRAGANGAVGTAAAAKSPADGYTFVVISNSTISAARHVYKDLPYDPEKDIVPVAPFVLAPSLLLAHPNFPAENFDQFLAQVRAGRDKYSYAHANTVGLVTGVALRKGANLDLIEVPYKSSPQAITDLIGGSVSFVIIDTVAASTAVKSGRVKPLAVTSAQRSALYPNTQAMSERVQGIDNYAWVGLGAPGATPQAIVDRMNQEIARITREKKTIDYFANMGSTLHPMSAADYKAFVQEQNRRWATMAREAGIKPE